MEIKSTWYRFWENYNTVVFKAFLHCWQEDIDSELSDYKEDMNLNYQNWSKRLKINKSIKIRKEY